MSAEALYVITLDIPNPEWESTADAGVDVTQVNSSISYAAGTQQVVTLSTTAISNGDDVKGLLYVPDLDPGDPCIEESAPYLPANVTRQANLPPIDYDLVALAPWLSPRCTQNYLAAARQDPIKGFIFFPPTNTTEPPPPASDPSWSLGDKGKWRATNAFPVYAISGFNGVILAYWSGQYSGNLTDVPYGPQLAGLYDPRDYVRLRVLIDTGSNDTFPSLWVFLLIVIGILCAIIAGTWIMLHVVQRRRRESLRRRVANGEVDLEALGIKRLTVPQEVLNEMPTYTYGTGAPATTASALSKTAGTVIETEKSETVTTTTSLPARPAPTHISRNSYRPSPLSQPTCAICLDDFQLADASNPGTTVRELPCHHIFHPECVDAFLRDSSSLCPMCKKTVLPKGYCPRIITNGMVRRERHLRRLRERISDGPDEQERGARYGDDDSYGSYSESRSQPNGSAMTESDRQRSSGGVRDRLRVPILPSWRSRSGAGTEVGQAQQLDPLPMQNPSSSPPPPGARREWARQRALAMLGPRRAPADPDVEDQVVRPPAWRKTMVGWLSGSHR